MTRSPGPSINVSRIIWLYGGKFEKRCIRLTNITGCLQYIYSCRAIAWIVNNHPQIKSPQIIWSLNGSAIWWENKSKRPFHKKFRCALGTFLPWGGNVDSRIPSLWTTSGLLLLNTGIASRWPGKGLVCCGMKISWGSDAGEGAAWAKSKQEIKLSIY